MPCELGVASLSAPRPASLGLPFVLSLGILAAGLGRVLAPDRAAFRTPLAVSPPLARFWGGISVWVASSSTSQRRFPRATAEGNVVVTFDATSPGAAGMGQDIPLVSHPAGDLQAPLHQN